MHVSITLQGTSLAPGHHGLTATPLRLLAEWLLAQEGSASRALSLNGFGASGLGLWVQQRGWVAHTDRQAGRQASRQTDRQTSPQLPNTHISIQMSPRARVYLCMHTYQHTVNFHATATCKRVRVHTTHALTYRLRTCVNANIQRAHPYT